jgi:glycosyltransferase involved in cell wall biosynthesis
MKDKLKIALMNIYSGTVDRGAETFAHEVAQRLSVKHDVTLFQDGPVRGRERYKVARLDMKIDWKRRDTSQALWAKLFIDYWRRKVCYFTLKSLPYIWKEKYDVVIPINGGWQPAFIRLITWLYGGRMVITGQSGIGWDDRNNLWSFPNTFVALSEKARSWAKKANPFVKLAVIPNGTDTNKFSPQGAKYETKLKQPIILCVGALIPTKRIDLVIKAVSKLEDVSLLVAGDGDWKDKISRMGKESLGDRFEVIKVPYEKMPEVYRAANLFTLVSKSYYAFEIVLVEAMASGLPVVANDDQIRKEIVGRAGILVNPEDVDRYAQAIKKALEKDWGNKPREQAKKFSWDNIAKEYEKLFMSLNT